MSVPDIVEKISSGNRRVLAKAITHIENRTAIGIKLRDHVFRGATTQVVGITGPPGSGKSTFVNQLIKRYREQDCQVAVIAIDPSSPYSGGALLGDRIRMLEYTQDPGVFIRSMASRGRLGGLSPACFSVIRLLQHANFDRIIVETVGAGQSEIDIVRNADTTIVLSVPGMGDDIQVIKAGIMEIADIFVVNKSDYPEASRLELLIKNMLDLVPKKSSWIPPVQLTNAQLGTGVDLALEKIENHWKYLLEDNRLELLKRRQIEFELLHQLHERQVELLRSHGEDPIDRAVTALVTGDWDLRVALSYLQDVSKS